MFCGMQPQNLEPQTSNPSENRPKTTTQMQIAPQKHAETYRKNTGTTQEQHRNNTETTQKQHTEKNTVDLRGRQLQPEAYRKRRAIVREITRKAGKHTGEKTKHDEPPEMWLLSSTLTQFTDVLSAANTSARSAAAWLFSGSSQLMLSQSTAPGPRFRGSVNTSNLSAEDLSKSSTGRVLVVLPVLMPRARSLWSYVYDTVLPSFRAEARAGLFDTGLTLGTRFLEAFSSSLDRSEERRAKASRE